MAVTDNDILEFAHGLLLGTCEIEFRNSTSNSYYAAYHKCRDMAKRLDVSLLAFEGGAHQKLINMFTQYYGTLLNKDEKVKLRAIGIILGQAKTYRTHADYDLVTALTNGDAHTVHALAIDIIKKVDDLLRIKGWN